MNARHLLPLLALIAAPLSHADSDRLMPARVPDAYKAECAACHTAYPPSLLPAASWQRIMGGLEHHYGTDASLDAATVKQLNGWLQAHAAQGGRRGVAPPNDRITESTWFVREHRGIDPAVWKLPSVKSAAQCAACHTGADQGDFDDDRIRIPAGVTPAQRRAFLD